MRSVIRTRSHGTEKSAPAGELFRTSADAHRGFSRRLQNCEVAQRYTHLSPAARRSAIDLLDEPTPFVETSMSKPLSSREGRGPNIHSASPLWAHHESLPVGPIHSDGLPSPCVHAESDPISSLSDSHTTRTAYRQRKGVLRRYSACGSILQTSPFCNMLSIARSK